MYQREVASARGIRSARRSTPPQPPRSSVGVPSTQGTNPVAAFEETRQVRIGGVSLLPAWRSFQLRPDFEQRVAQCLESLIDAAANDLDRVPDFQRMDRSRCAMFVFCITTCGMGCVKGLSNG